MKHDQAAYLPKLLAAYDAMLLAAWSFDMASGFGWTSHNPTETCVARVRPLNPSKVHRLNWVHISGATQACCKHIMPRVFTSLARIDVAACHKAFLQL